MGRKATPASVVTTTRNEAHTIDGLLESLTRQTLAPAEVIVVDGGSTDGTLEALRRWEAGGRLPLTVITAPGANISAGRNAGIAVARGPWIAVTDAGVVLDPEWLRRLVVPLAAGGQAAAGFFRSDPTGAFETAVGATTLPEERDVNGRGFLPSSRSVAFLKSAWSTAGGYPEWLDTCEDLVFDLRVQGLCGPWIFVPGAVANFRPRRSLRSFARQYYRYARGDGKADLWPWRHAVRYATYAILVPGLLVIGAAGHRAAMAALALGMAAVLRTPYRRLTHQWGPLGPWSRLQAALWVPVIRITGDVAKMIGYPVGWAWRLRQRPPAWRLRPASDVSATRPS